MYYNQNDYLDPYPHADRPNATIKTSGCGPTSMAMVLEDLTGQTHPPPQLAQYAIACGARVSTGTDLGRLCRSIAADYGLQYRTSSQAAEALAALARGAKVIANVGGAHSAAGGLFSTEGHYIYLRSARGSAVTVWDAGYYPGKYSSPGRAEKVSVSYPDLYAAAADIQEDCSNRSPRYYILEDAMTYAQFKEFMSRYEAEKRALPASEWAQEAWQAAGEQGIFDGTMPQAPLTREQAALVIGRLKEHCNDA